MNSTTAKRIKPIEDLEVSDTFSYKTINQVELGIKLLNSENLPISGVHFYVCKDTLEAEDPSENFITQGLTNDNGELIKNIAVPAFMKEIVIIGFMTTETVEIIDNKANIQIGGMQIDSRESFSFSKPRDDFFEYMDDYPYNSYGVPDNMSYVSLSCDFLGRISYLFPEHWSLPDFRPSLYDEDYPPNINITDDNTEVSITFIYEGTGKKNSLGFYTYETGNPPDVDDLDIRTLEILESYLDAYRGCVLVVSHDRYFLDRVIDYLFVFEEDGIRKFPGNYSDYLLVKRFHEEEKAHAEREEKKQQLEVERKIKKVKKKLSYNEEKELSVLESEINLIEEKQSESICIPPIWIFALLSIISTGSLGISSLLVLMYPSCSVIISKALSKIVTIS